jgi:hypothetical protein
MEALSTIALAGNVLQFVQFVSVVVSTGLEMYDSASGASKRNVELESIYERLSTFTSSLQSQEAAQVSCLLGTRGFPAFAQTKENLAHVSAVNGLAKDCKGLCDQLLETIRKLKVEGGRWRRFSSFKAALKSVWESEKIEALEARLDRLQRVILFHFFPILRYFCNLWIIQITSEY